MALVFADHENRKLVQTENVTFRLNTAGIYLVEITVRAKNEKQLGETDGENLRIEIDRRKFPQLNNPQRYSDSPASFSGAKLKNLKKSVFFLLNLSAESHTLTLIPDISATLENIRVWQLENTSAIELSLNIQAEDGDRRPWITLVLIDLGLKQFTASFTLKRRFIDSDDVKIIIDGEIRRNGRSILHKFWYFIASIFTSEKQTETFVTNSTLGLHYLEFWADKMPTLEKIVFFGLSAASPTENSPEAIKAKIKYLAVQYGLNPEIMVRVAQFESRFNPQAVSPQDAKGIFQLTDITIKQIVSLGFKIDDPFNIDQNINGGIIYFRWLHDLYEDQQDPLNKTLVAWNWGLNRFSKSGPINWKNVPAETKKFIRDVLGKE